MTYTNAQVALLASNERFEATTSVATVLRYAEKYKEWLDEQDEKDANVKATRSVKPHSGY